MPRKKHKPEEIVAKLRQVDVLVSQGQSQADAVRSIGVNEVTYLLGCPASSSPLRADVRRYRARWIVRARNRVAPHDMRARSRILLG